MNAKKIGMDHLRKFPDVNSSPMVMFWLGKISEKTNNFQESDNTFKNPKISTTAQNGSIDVDKNLTFNNKENSISYHEHNNEFERTKSHFSNSAKTVSALNNKATFTQTNTELNVPNEIKASNSDININITNQFENSAKSINADD